MLREGTRTCPLLKATLLFSSYRRGTETREMHQLGVNFAQGHLTSPLLAPLVGWFGGPRGQSPRTGITYGIIFGFLYRIHAVSVCRGNARATW